MGMIRSSITVIAQDQWSADGTSAESDDSAAFAPVPAGVLIPVESAVIAVLNNETGFQELTINLRDSGFEPALIIVQKNIPVNWTINNDSLDEGNSTLIVPTYLARLDVENGNNVIQFMPLEDFDFSTGDNIYYGYVKVVDDINNFDMNTIKGEVGNFETLIYPEAYFEASAQGGCCARS
jgi:plastocyanin domain-containing protein